MDGQLGIELMVERGAACEARSSPQPPEAGARRARLDGVLLMAAISASETTMPLGYWPVSSSQRTVRPVLVVVAEISSTITR